MIDVDVASQSLIKDLPTKPFGTPFDKVWHITLTLGTRLRFYDCFMQTSVKKCTKSFYGEASIRDWDGTPKKVSAFRGKKAVFGDKADHPS